MTHFSINKLGILMVLILFGIGSAFAQQKTRTEKDLLGEKQIPFEAYYGVSNHARPGKLPDQRSKNKLLS
jgi:hypothetical protein